MFAFITGKRCHLLKKHRVFAKAVIVKCSCTYRTSLRAGLRGCEGQETGTQTEKRGCLIRSREKNDDQFARQQSCRPFEFIDLNRQPILN